MKKIYINELIRNMPKQFDTSTSNSFARDIIQNTYPKLLKDMIESNMISNNYSKKLSLLLNELKEGKVKEPAEKNKLSNQWFNKEPNYSKRTWLDLPSYWAESYFFYRIGEIFRYTLDIGTFEDPFFFKKELELKKDKISHLLDKCEYVLTEVNDKEKAIYDGLILSLIGNMADLSHNISNTRKDIIWDEKTILSNDIKLIINNFIERKHNSLIFVADNAGEELIFDLLLCVILLKYNIFDEISIHLKPYPFFVSDATLVDVQYTISKMPNTSILKQSLLKLLNNGQLKFETNHFYASPYFFYEMPKELLNKFKKASYTICKGDLNYRRLLGDARWDTSISFSHITSYFPTSLIALRVMKSDIAVGIPKQLAEFLNFKNPSWRHNGKYSVVQMNKKD